MVETRTRMRKVQDEHGTSGDTRKQGKASKIMGTGLQKHTSWHAGPLTGHVRDNLSIKTRTVTD